MSDFKLELVERRTSARNAAYLLFVGRYNPKSSTHYVFCESSDDSQYYDLMLRREFSASTFDFIPANGKSLVLHTREKLTSKGYDHSRIEFIIDRDHDGFIPRQLVVAPDVFVSDYYSVESYLYSPETFVCLIEQFCALARNDPAALRALELFDFYHKAYLDAMVEPMALAIVLRRCGGADSLHFGNIKLHQFFIFGSNGDLEIRNGLAAAIRQQWAGNTDKGVASKVTRLAVSLNKKDARLWIRGKFLSWWYARVFNVAARTIAATLTDRNGQPIRCTLQFGDSHFIPATKVYGKCPPRLRSFFAKRLGAR